MLSSVEDMRALFAPTPERILDYRYVERQSDRSIRSPACPRIKIAAASLVKATAMVKDKTSERLGPAPENPGASKSHLFPLL